MLREVISSAQVSPGDRASAARSLGGLGPGYTGEAAAVLREVIASAQVSPSDRASAADHLGGLGPAYIEEAAATLREVISSAQAYPRPRQRRDARSPRTLLHRGSRSDSAGDHRLWTG